MSPCSLVLCMDSNELLISYWHLYKSGASGWEGRLPGQRPQPAPQWWRGTAWPRAQPRFCEGSNRQAPGSALWGPGTPHTRKARPWRVAFAEARQGLSLASVCTPMLSLSLTPASLFLGFVFSLTPSSPSYPSSLSHTHI